MRLSLLLSLYLFSIPVPAGALEVSQGADIVGVTRTMKVARYPETMLAMGFSNDANALLEMWTLDQGILAVAYSKATNKVKSVVYFLSDERPRAFRKTFSLRVARFDTDSGKMEIETVRPMK